MQRIHADQLIPGRGDPVSPGVLVLDGPTITYAGPAEFAPEQTTEPIRVRTVMPGMWDVHTHLFGGRPGATGYAAIAIEHPATRAARCVQALERALDAGVTSIRELGGLGLQLAPVIQEGRLRGPTIHAAGSVLSITGGHGDIHEFPTDWVNDIARMGAEFRLVDGEAECARAVREQIRRGAQIIKVCATGGVMSVIDDPNHQQFTHRELAVMVEVAAMAERSVAAHCHGKAGIMAALSAGVHTIEHGTYLDDEACAAMRETGAILVPTRTIIHELLGDDGLHPNSAQKLQAIDEVHRDNMIRAYEADVTIAMGSDLGLTGDGPATWGRNGMELTLLTDLGLSPLEAIEAATAIGPETLGLRAPRSGQLRAGYDADVLAVNGDPLADPSLLAEPSRITTVWKAGELAKTSGGGSTMDRSTAS